MVNTLLGLISGVTVNYISDELLQRLGAYTDKKAIREFLETLNSWALDFETGQDGTIAASGTFYSYVKYHHIVEQIISYVLVPDTSRLPEQLFLEQLEQAMSRELEQRLERGLSPEDSQVIRDFLGSLLRQTKNFALWQTVPEDKALLYYLCQNNAELSQIKRTMEEQFQCTKEMIQKILYRLESSPQAEMAPVPLTDETQLPKEFNTLIRKYNGALRKSQRMVKVYSWDNLDFRSVYVLPSLEISIELNDDLFFTPQKILVEPSSRVNNVVTNRRPSAVTKTTISKLSDLHFSDDLLHSYFTEAEMGDTLAKAVKEDSPQRRRAKIDEIFQHTDIIYHRRRGIWQKPLPEKLVRISAPVYAIPGKPDAYHSGRPKADDSSGRKL